MDYEIIELDEFEVMGRRYRLSKSLDKNVKIAQRHWKHFNHTPSAKTEFTKKETG